VPASNPPAKPASLWRAAELLRHAKGAIVAILGYVGGLFGPVLGLAGVYETLNTARVSLQERHGRIVEGGSHRSLLAAGGYYATLVEKQARGLLPMVA
jgi:hypothetical protein